MIRDELAFLTQLANEKREVERRAETIDETTASNLTRAYLTGSHVNREVLAALALAGFSEDQLAGIETSAQQQMLRAGVIPEPDNDPLDDPQYAARQAFQDFKPTLGLYGPGTSAMTQIGQGDDDWITDKVRRGIQGVSDTWQSAWDQLPEGFTSPVTASLKGAVRTGLAAMESGGQYVNNRAGQAWRYADSKNYQWWDTRWTADFINKLAETPITSFAQNGPEGVIRSAEDVVGSVVATDVGQIGKQILQTGDVDMGSGFTPQGTVRTGQAQAQRDLLGTLPGPNGEQYGWTVGRQVAQLPVEAGLFTHDSVFYSMMSGLIDGTVKAVFDASNVVPGAAIGRRAIEGAKMPRNAIRYNELASEARSMMQNGNERLALLKMREAREAIGIRSAGLSDDVIRQSFDVDPADVMLRAEMYDEAGIYMQGDTVQVSLPEVAKFFAQGKGRRAVDLIVQRKTAAEIIDLFSDSISPTLAKELAGMDNATEVISRLGRAYGNPGELLEDGVTMFPNVGVFNIRDKASVVRRSFGAHTRLGTYLPPTSIVDPKQPTVFIHDFKLLAKSMPLGVARDGFARFDPRIVDEYVNRFVDAFASGNRGQLVGVVGDFEAEMVTMFNRLGYTLEEATDLTRWGANADRLGQYVMKDLAASSASQVAEAGIAAYSDLLQSGVMLLDNNRLQEILRSTGRVRQILRNHSEIARVSDDVAKLSDQITEAIQAGDNVTANTLAKKRSKLQRRREELLEKKQAGKAMPQDAIYWLDATRNLADSAQYVWKSSTIFRLAYLTRVLPDEISRILAGGIFDGPSDYIVSMAMGRNQSDALGRAFERNAVKAQDIEMNLLDLRAELSVAREAGNTAEVDRLRALIETDSDRLAAAIDEFDVMIPTFHQALIGQERGRASRTFMRDQLRSAHASGMAKEVNRFNVAQQEMWTEGLVQQLVRRSGDPVYSEIARAMLGMPLKLNAPFEVMGVKATLQQHLAARRIANVEDGVAYWLWDGPGRDIWQEFVYSKTATATGTSYNVNSFDSVKTFVGQMSDEIAYLTGGKALPIGVAGPDTAARIIPVSRTDFPVTNNIDAAVTGKRFTGVFSRGVGGKGMPGTGDGALFGPGLYAAKTPEDAASFATDFTVKPEFVRDPFTGEYKPSYPRSGEVFNVNIELESPLVLTPEVWNKLTSDLGLFRKFVDKTSRDKLVDFVKQQGYDGIVVRLGDVDSALADMAGVDQVVKFAPQPTKNPPSRLQNTDMNLLRVIADGTFEGTPINRVNTKRTIVYNEDAIKYIDNFRTADNAPNNLNHFGKTPFKDIGIKDQAAFSYQAFIDFGFQGFYGVPSDVLARAPMFRRTYWNVMADLIRSADPQASATIIRNAQKAKVSNKVMDQLIANSRFNLADASVDELDQLAKGRALEEVRDLLFDATRRGATADALRFVVVFGDAFKEVWQTYGKLVYRGRGKPALRVAQAYYAGTKTTVGGPGDVYGVDPLTGEPSTIRDGRPESIFYKDPITRDMVYSLPFSRNVISMFAGMRLPFVGAGVNLPVENAPALVAPLSGLNLAGSIFPGFGPIAETFVNSLLPEGSRMNAVRDFLFPYGEPPGPESVAGQTEGVESLAPGWAQKFGALFRSSEAIGFFGTWLSQAETNSSYQNMRNHVARAMMSSELKRIKKQIDAGNEEAGAGSPLLVQNQEEFRKKVNTAADRLWALRGIAQFVGPAAPFIQYYNDNAVAALMVDEMNRSMDSYIEQGLSPDMAITDLIDKYGWEVFLYVTPNTSSTIKGIDSSKEWFEFYQDNKDFIDSYKAIGGFFAPTGEFNNDVRSSLLSRGLYEVKSPEEQFEDAAFSLAYAAYNRQRASFGSETKLSDDERQYLSEYRQAMSQQFGVDLETFANEKKLQIAQLELLIDNAFSGKDSNAYGYLDNDFGRSVLRYMAEREAVMAEAERRGTNYSNGKRAADLRERLRALGSQLSEDNPQFSRFYQFVLEGEMVNADKDEPSELPTIQPVR